MYYKIIIASILLFAAIRVTAQQGSATGTIIDLKLNKVITNARVKLAGADIYETASDENGKFIIHQIPEGNYTLTVEKEDYEKYVATVHIKQGENQIGFIILNLIDINADRLIQDDIPTVSLSDSDLRNNASQNVSGVLSASRDAFISAASFNWGNMRFRIRGYDYENFTTLMNGAPMNDLTNGQVYWSTWGGLNDVMRNRENLLGIAASTFNYGVIGGSFDLDCRASRQRKGLSLSYALSNRSYDHRLMATYNTGLLKNGWAVSVSASRRWAKEGYIPGTFFDGYAYFASIEKLIGFKHSVSLTAFASPTRIGRSAPAVQEMYDIAGNNYYNPLWGYQQGKKRNASVAQSFQPVFILNHEWKINNKSSIETAASVLFGKNSISGLDWYNAPDPRPDFYRRLPSFISDSAQRIQAIDFLKSNEAARQIDWDKLYHINMHNIETVAQGAAGDSVTGRRSLYIIGNRVTENLKYNFNTVYNNAVSNHVILTLGATYQRQLSDFYQEVADLLGGDFWLNYNQFAERDFPNNDTAYRNDLNNPDPIVKAGEKYGYHYLLHNCRTSAWAQSQFKFNHFEFFIAGELSGTRYWREGKTRSGLFPDNSFGKGTVQKFFNYNIKGGITYKINGRNYLYTNGSVFTRAPYITDVLVSPRTRDQYAANLENSFIYSAEAGYLLRSPKIKGRATAYVTQFNNQIQTYTFYHEEYRTQVNYTLNNVDTRHVGAELSLEAKIYKGLSAVAVASVGRYYYTDRMNATITQDNTQEILSNETVYSKNYRLAGSPQHAYNAGISYRSKKFWFINLNFNVYDEIYIAINPARRTQQAVDLVAEGSAQWNNILEQEEVNKKFSQKYSIDLFGGKSWKLTRKRINDKYHVFLVLNVGINNITNNRNMISGGYEQLRFDFNERNPKKFDNKYFYNFGTTYFINIAFRLN